MTCSTRLATLVAVALVTATTPMLAQAATDSLPRPDSSSAILPRHLIESLGATRTAPLFVAQDSVRRPRAIEYSDAYHLRLTIHQVASYAELPLFAAEYVVGTKVLNDERTKTNGRSSLKGLHSGLAGGLEALFAVNTVTGLWNLYESRHDPAGRTRRIIHSIAMLAADAGFLLTAGIAEDAGRTDNGATRHRSAAVASMSVATASTLMMWLWRN